MLTKGKFLVSFEVPGHTKEYTEGFTEEMVIPYRTEELNIYLRYPQPKDKQQSPSLRTHKITNKRYTTDTPNRYNHNRYNITTMNIIYHIIRIILSVGTILTLIRNEKIYQAHKYTHPTNKLRYIISQTLILILYTSSLILVSYTYRIILTHL